jgi:hypothetical protein
MNRRNFIKHLFVFVMSLFGLKLVDLRQSPRITHAWDRTHFWVTSDMGDVVVGTPDQQGWITWHKVNRIGDV